MRNKILLVSTKEDQQVFEQALEAFLDAGGIFLYASTKDMAHQVFEIEHPSLVFIHQLFYNDPNEWVLLSGKALIVILCHKSESFSGVECLTRPFKAERIIFFCRQAFPKLSTLTEIPPM